MGGHLADPDVFVDVPVEIVQNFPLEIVLHQRLGSGTSPQTLMLQQAQHHHGIGRRHIGVVVKAVMLQQQPHLVPHHGGVGQNAVFRNRHDFIGKGGGIGVYFLGQQQLGIGKMHPEKFTLAVEVSVLVAAGGQKQVFPLFDRKLPVSVCDKQGSLDYNHQLIVGEKAGQVNPVGIRGAEIACHMEEQWSPAVNAVNFHSNGSSYQIQANGEIGKVRFFSNLLTKSHRSNEIVFAKKKPFAII